MSDVVLAGPEAQISDPESFGWLAVATEAVTGILAVKTTPRAAMLRGHRRVDPAAALAALHRVRAPKDVGIKELEALRSSLPPYLTATVVCPAHLLGSWNVFVHHTRGEREEHSAAVISAEAASAVGSNAQDLWIGLGRGASRNAEGVPSRVID